MLYMFSDLSLKSEHEVTGSAASSFSPHDCLRQQPCCVSILRPNHSRSILPRHTQRHGIRGAPSTKYFSNGYGIYPDCTAPWEKQPPNTLLPNHSAKPMRTMGATATYLTIVGTLIELAPAVTIGAWVDVEVTMAPVVEEAIPEVVALGVPLNFSTKFAQVILVTFWK